MTLNAGISLSRLLQNKQENAKKKYAVLERKEHDWVAQLKKKQKEEFNKNMDLIKFKVNYDHETPWIDNLVSNKNSGNQKKDKRINKNNQLKTKKFQLGKGFVTLDSYTIVGSLKPLMTTLQSIDLSDQSIGRRGCQLLQEYLCIRECHITCFKMVRSKLTDENLSIIMQVFSENESIHVLDLSQNSMSHLSFTALGKALKSNCALQDVKLAWNNCHGKGLKEFSKGLLANKSIVKLDISWNLLAREDKGNEDIKEISPSGLSKSADTDKKNPQNNLSTTALTKKLILDSKASAKDATEAIRLFAYAISKARSIRHLDLSNCCLNSHHSRIMGDALIRNYFITGIHFEGNTGYLDSKGFIVQDFQSNIINSTSDLLQSGNAITVQSSYSSKMGNDSLSVDVGSSRLANNPEVHGLSLVKNQCWKCKKWNEVCFRFQPINWMRIEVGSSKKRFEKPPLAVSQSKQIPSGGGFNLEDDTTVWLHLSTDGWKADSMFVDEETGGFILHRALPPGRVWYYFSVGGRTFLSSTDRVAMHPRLNLERNYMDITPANSTNVTTENSGYNKKLKNVDALKCTKQTSNRKTKINKGGERVDAYGIPLKGSVLLNNEVGDFVRARPRDVALSQHIERLNTVTLKPQWDPYRSPFKLRVQLFHDIFDSQEAVLRPALSNDIGYTKLVAMKVCTSKELTDLISQLEANYSIYCRLFQLYAAADTTSDPYDLGWEEFEAFCSDHKIIDSHCTAQVVNDIFLVTNVELEADAENDADSLTRFEFIEMLVRIALYKYPNLKAGGAICRLLREVIMPRVRDRALLDNDYFRYTCLYTQPVGKVLQKYEKRLRKIYNDYASKTTIRTPYYNHREMQKVMSIDDYHIFTYESNIMPKETKQFNLLDAKKIFTRSKLLSMDEQEYDIHETLFFCDFLEVITRLVCHPPILKMIVKRAHINELTGTFAEILEEFIKFIIENIYFVDVNTGRLLRKHPTLRSMPIQTQKRIKVGFVRVALGLHQK